MSSKRIYLASPYGFAKQWQERLLPDFIKLLEGLGLEVWEPFARNSQLKPCEKGWAHRVAKSDLNDVVNADAIFAIVNGTPPDEGVMIEIGIAIGLGKPIFLFRDDFRKCCDSEEYPLNLMLFSAFPSDSWKDYYYTSLPEVKDPQKALIRWVNDCL